MSNFEIEETLKCALRKELNEEFDQEKEKILNDLNLEIELKRNKIIGDLINTLSFEISRNEHSIEPVINIQIITRPKITIKEEK